MREWIPVPGTAKARLVEAALYHFELEGFDAVNVVDLAAKASVTTGSLYHHFESKRGLYLLVRGDMEKRMVERMEGAAAAVGARGRAAVSAALLVAFDAATRFEVCRVLGEAPPAERPDPIESALRPLLPKRLSTAAAVSAAAWRAALLAVADGTPTAPSRASLRFFLEPQ